MCLIARAASGGGRRDRAIAADAARPFCTKKNYQNHMVLVSAKRHAGLVKDQRLTRIAVVGLLVKRL